MRDVQGCGSGMNSKSRVSDMYVTGYVYMWHPRFQLITVINSIALIVFDGRIESRG
jgi:hypothetical protein